MEGTREGYWLADLESRLKLPSGVFPFLYNQVSASLPAVQPTGDPPPASDGQNNVPRPPASSWLQPIVLAPIAAAVLIMLGIAGWLIVPKLRDQFKGSRTPPARTETPKTPTNHDTPGLPSRQTPQSPEGSPSSTIKVPSQVATLTKAIELCKEGGTIELGGGTYPENIRFTKSVALIANPSAVIVDRGLGTNLIIARGPVKVTLRNIQIVNTTEETKSSHDESPALVLVSDSAHLTLDGCVIEGSVGNGITLTDKASASFSNCRIRGNLAWGINVKSAASVDVSLSDILRNGRSGITLANVGSVVTLGKGCNISENSLNGVEVLEGAKLQCDGVDIKNNRKAGVAIVGSGSLANLEANCRISNNGTHGIAIQHSGVARLRDATVEENKENGLWAGKMPADAYSGEGCRAGIVSSKFASNGLCGVFFDDGKSANLKLEKSGFKNHSQCGIAVSGGSGTVEDCKFTDNGTAILFGDGVSGAITNNTIRPGPIESAVILDKAGEVSLQNNTVDPTP